MFWNRKKQKEEKMDIKDLLERKIISSSYINPTLTESFINSTGRLVQEMNMMEYILKKNGRFEEADRLLSKLKEIVSGKDSLQIIYSLTALRLEVEASGFLNADIKTEEELEKMWL